MKVMNNLSTRLLFAMVVMLVMTAMAATAWGQTTYTSTLSNAKWESQVWSPVGTPTSIDTVIIADGDTVTIDTTESIASLTVGQGSSGILQFLGNWNNPKHHTLTVSNNVLIMSGGQLLARASTDSLGWDTLFLGGNLTNNGTFNAIRTSEVQTLSAWQRCLPIRWVTNSYKQPDHRF